MRILALSLCVGLAAATGCGHAANSGGDGDGGGGGHGGKDGGSGGDMAPTFQIAPLNDVITYSDATTPPVQFSATRNGAPLTATWTIDSLKIGTMSATGLFTANGLAAGTANVYAKVDGENVSTSLTVKIAISQVGDPAYPAPAPGAGGYGGVGGDGPGAPATAAQKATLDGAATADTAVKLLYPYDGTVWPRGLLSPLLQWDSGGHNFDAVKISLVENSYSFTGYLAKPSTATGKFQNVTMPQLAWQALTDSNVGEDAVVTLTFAEGATAIGPITVKWKVAPSTLKGTVYYSSYGTTLVKNSGEPSCGVGDNNCDKKSNRHGPAFGGATLAIKVGTTDPVLVAGTKSDDNTGCRVCHTVAQNGSRLMTQHGDDYTKDSLYQLTMANAETHLMPNNVAFPAMYPDGSLFFSSSGGIINGDSKSQLYSLPDATVVPTTGMPDNFQAAVPAFSPDGKQLAFNFYANATGADGQSLGMMNFDLASKTFSNLGVAWTPSAPNNGTVVWPSFLPTSTSVVFELEKVGNEWGFTRSGNKGELWIYDNTSKQATRLDKLNGLGYVPTLDGNNHTADNEPVINYEPTVNPIASGGYAWVVFTSRRLYGNVATLEPWTSDPRNYHWQSDITTKKLWVAAIDLNGSGGVDPSHPAFYLPAQELYAGNMRGFWSLDPCQADDTTCTSGDQCCGGYCDQIDPYVSMCTSTPPVCANEFEKCTKDADCCDTGGGIVCVNNVCTYSAPPIP